MNVLDIRLPKKDTDFSKMRKYDWDVVIGKIPMRVGVLDGFVHTIGGKWGNNELYAWPRNEEPNYENITPFDSDHIVDWGIEYKENHYYGSTMGESEIRSTGRSIITRNGVPFYTVRGGRRYSMLKASVIIDDLGDAYPINFEFIDYQKQIIGRKIAYKGVICEITNWIEGQGCIIIKPEKELSKEELKDKWGIDDEYEYDGDLKIDIIGYNQLGIIDWYPKASALLESEQ
jgi:hypothetical protein